MIELTEGISEENLAALYADPFVSRVCDDGMPFAPVVHPLVSYLSAEIDGQFAGAYLIVRFSDTEHEVHSLLMRRATMASRDLAREMFRWVFHHDAVMRLTAYVRDGIPTSVNHCLKMGFKYEGFRRDALKVNGEPKGIHILGMTRREWCAL